MNRNPKAKIHGACDLKPALSPGARCAQRRGPAKASAHKQSSWSGGAKQPTVLPDGRFAPDASLQSRSVLICPDSSRQPLCLPSPSPSQTLHRGRSVGQYLPILLVPQPRPEPRALARRVVVFAGPNARAHNRQCTELARSQAAEADGRDSARRRVYVRRARRRRDVTERRGTEKSGKGYSR